LCCYDYILTLDREIKFIWKADLSLATSLYYASRYAALSNTIIVLLTRIAWTSWQTIYVSLHRHSVLPCIPVKCLHLCSANINVSMQYIFVVTSPELYVVMGFQACTFSIIGSYSSYETLMISARAASLVSDGLVLTLTCMKTARKTDSGFIKSPLGPSLQDILLRDTTICFAFLCVINVIGIATGRMIEFIDIWQSWTAM
ncbi:uncharacterized protein LAESUDRAFT_652332, partial [Laetiporus sulphureus 93-53]